MPIVGVFKIVQVIIDSWYEAVHLYSVHILYVQRKHECNHVIVLPFLSISIERLQLLSLIHI